MTYVFLFSLVLACVLFIHVHYLFTSCLLLLPKTCLKLVYVCETKHLSGILVGNKDDDPSRKVVLTQDAKQFAEQIGIQLFETSAKENKNVEEVSQF